MVIKHADFPMLYVEEKKFKSIYVDEIDYKGYLSQIHIIKANQPQKQEGEEYIERANSGYKWLEFYPENSNIAMTVCYNNENKILQWYFDIINNVGIENNNPYFEDLYLDVTLTPENRIELLDEDEIKEALELKDISNKQYDMAYKTANELMKRIDGKVKEIAEFSNKYFDKINLIAQIKDEDIGLESVCIEKFRQRYGARGIVINEDGKIAVFNKSLKNEFKLPGGGIDEGEETAEAFKRESFEETGCTIEIIDFLGTIEEIKTHDSFKQMSYVYVGKVIKNTNELHVTKQEEKEGAKLLWEEPVKALELIKSCYDKLLPSPCENNLSSVYHTKFIVKRDSKILEEYLKDYKREIEIIE